MNDDFLVKVKGRPKTTGEKNTVKRVEYTFCTSVVSCIRCGATPISLEEKAYNMLEQT